ncbi:MAG: protein of unknown function DUF427 [uncultured Thermomicrobiales bacterium]|uniref:DUF427 domain-containing protein n=1 Tax=uncultured Thermomicrobiales bacterium TaxID=1645740 RepID=A0A6J4VG15_9BACT|nr:MAG: protein of unknown function DUF427 [uncultured Thermomicrobiales bacterium]
MAQSLTPHRPTDGFMPPAPAVEPSPRWVRVCFGGEVVADSKRALLLRQYGLGRLPTYYFPQADVRMDLLERAAPDPPDDDIARWTLRVGDRVAAGAASMLLAPLLALATLAGHVTFDWDAMDAWHEEEEEIFVHARDPHKRVDVMWSSREVRVVIDGETVAETRRPALLFETSLPTRYYLPVEDVRRERLEPSDTATRCPYKGIARYWSVRIGDRVARDVVWSYPDPIAECPKIRGLLCFFNERVDIYVDGELQARPQSPWSEESDGEGASRTR